MIPAMPVSAIFSAINRSGLSQAQVCRKGKIRPGTLCEIYNGKVTRPHASTVARIALAIGVDPDELICQVREGGDVQ